MILLCGQRAGEIAMGFFHPAKAVCYDYKTKTLSDDFGGSMKVYNSISEVENESDVFLSVHGREIIPSKVWKNNPCFNIHPYLRCYKGTDPVGRAIKDGNTRASVGLHEVNDKLDEGRLIFEVYKDINMSDPTHEMIYNQLYPLYYLCFEVFQKMYSEILQETK